MWVPAVSENADENSFADSNLPWRQPTGSARRLLYAIGQHFKLTEVDGAVFGMEHILAVVMKGDSVERFASDWVTVIAGMKKKAED